MSSPSSPKPTVYLAGATGLTGSDTLLSLLSLPTLFSSISTLTRRPLPTPSSSSLPTPTTPHTNLIFDFSDPSTWSLEKTGGEGGGAGEKVFISCLGTTRAAAGSVEKQREVDLELNWKLAKAAKEEGVETFILVSSSGASSTAYAAYPAMKGELEDRIKSLAFRRTLILQPGLLIGGREREDKRAAEGVAQSVWKGLRRWGVPGGDAWGVETKVVGQAIAKLALSKEEGVHYYNNREIIALGSSPPSS